MNMKKKRTSRKAFAEYRVKQFKMFLKNVYPHLIRDHTSRINKFRNEWEIPPEMIKTEKEYKDWLEKVERTLSHKRRSIEYLEMEEYHFLEGFETTAIDYPLLTEKEPRIISQGNSLEAVFNHDVKKLTRELNIDPDCYSLFRLYILSDEVSADAITSTGISLSERILFGETVEEVDYKISLSFGPNVEWGDLKEFWDLRIEELRRELKGSWDKRMKKGKYDDLLSKLTELDAKSRQGVEGLSDYEIAERLFGNVETDPKLQYLSDKEIGQEENRRRQVVRNLRYRYLKKKSS